LIYRNQAVLFSDKHVVQGLKFTKKNNRPNFSRYFLLVVLFMMQIKFNFNNFTFYGMSAAAGQRHTPSSLAVVIGLSNNDVISLRPLRQFCYVLYVACVALDGNPALTLYW